MKHCWFFFSHKYLQTYTRKHTTRLLYYLVLRVYTAITVIFVDMSPPARPTIVEFTGARVEFPGAPNEFHGLRGKTRGKKTDA